MDNSDDHVEDETRDDEEVERFTNENGGIEPGKRSSRWFDRVEKTIQDNRKRSVQNRNLLERVDMRTVWIARILVALLATVVGGLILQILI